MTIKQILDKREYPLDRKDTVAVVTEVLSLLNPLFDECRERQKKFTQVWNAVRKEASR